jgi:hypothetical protein
VANVHRWHLAVRRVTRTVACVACLLLPGSPAEAQPRDEATTGESLVVGVLTMGQGDLVYELFGHNAIWIHDPAAGTSRVYNYGVFDFDSPGYWGRFVRGTWLYQLVVTDLQHTLATYRFLNRTVWLQVLNLTDAQKRALRDFLEWNARPENRDYLYDYYRDNCSTRVRDALDQALGGALAAPTRGVTTATTYRWHSERLIASDRLSYTGILIGLGPAADREIDAWEEMFIPFKVQEQLRRLQVEGEDGRMVPLVASEETLYTATGRPGELATPPVRLHWYLLAGLAGGALLWGIGRASAAGLAIAGGLWGVLAGLLGLLLAGLWAFTNHTIAYHNLSLLQLNPLAVGMVVLLPAVAAGARWAVRPARGLSFVLAGLSLLGLALFLLPGIVQQNLPVILLALPIHLGLAAALSRVARPIPDAGRAAART